jgi:hypothetical protein
MMTTTVKVFAHCDPKTTQVKIATDDPNNPQTAVYIEDGETHEAVVYDDRALTISEVPK